MKKRKSKARGFFLGCLLILFMTRATAAQSPVSWRDLNELAVMLYRQGKYYEGIRVAEKALELAKIRFGVDDVNTAIVMNNLALLYKASGNYGKARPLYEKTEEIFEKIEGPEGLHVATSLDNLAGVYEAEGKLDRAVSLRERALAIYLKILGPLHTDTAISRGNLAELYRQMARYKEAEPLFKQAVEGLEKAEGAESPVVATVLDNWAGLYLDQGRYVDAEPLRKRALGIYQKVLGTEHPDTAISMANLAVLYRDLGKYAEAETLLRQALEINKKLFGDSHPAVAHDLTGLGHLYQDQGRLAEAEALFNQALEIREKAFPPDHPELADSFESLAELYKEQGKYLEAEPLYRKVLSINESVYGSSHPNVGATLSNLASLYEDLARYTEAESLYQRARSIHVKAYGEIHATVATDLNNLGTLYRIQARYPEAERLFKKAIAMATQKLGAEHPNVARGLNNLGLLYENLGKYAEAELLYVRALAIDEKSRGPESLNVARDLTNLGEVYRVEGKYAELEELEKRALAINEKVLGPQHPSVAVNLNNLGGLYAAMGRHDEAESLYRRALAIDEKAHGVENPAVARDLDNLAELFHQQGKLVEAEEYFEKALAINQKIFGPDHLEVAKTLNNLAGLYANEGQYGKALSLLERTVRIKEKALGPDHLDLGLSLSNLGALYAVTGHPSQALPILKRVMSIEDKGIENVFSLASEQEKMVFLDTLHASFMVFLSLVFHELHDQPQAWVAGMNAVLRRKGLVLEALSRERESLENSERPEIRKTYAKLRQVSARLASLTLAGPGDKGDPLAYRKELELLEHARENLERELAQKSGAYRMEKKTRAADVASVAGRLPAGSVLIEYVVAPTFNFKVREEDNRWGEEHYLAFILSSASRKRKEILRPSIADLGPASTVDLAVREFREEISKTAQDYAANGLNMDARGAERRLTEKGRRLHALLIRPLMKGMGGHQTIFVSPDGELNLIPFAVLPDEKGHYLIENYQIHYVSSGRDLLRMRLETRRKKGGESVLVADPDFDMSQEEREAKATHLLAREKQVVVRGISPAAPLARVHWDRLPGTLEEARSIEKILSGEPLKSYTNRSALKEVVMRFRSPRRLHVATHGFFLEEEVKSKDGLKGSRSRGLTGNLRMSVSTGSLAIKNPLLRSGLVLAGANRLGRETGGSDNGILTALEVTGMQLSGTDLVVLSACETGVGQTRRGEGVFGLRRAFQLAGARTVIMSLWTIPDQETRDLMVDFYRRMKKGEAKSAALRAAQLDMIRTRRKHHGDANPYFWGAFMSVGEP